MVDRLEKQGKLQIVTPGNIAYYTIQHLMSGRRSKGLPSMDVYGSTTQLPSQLASCKRVANQCDEVQRTPDQYFNISWTSAERFSPTLLPNRGIRHD